ncbi:MAG: hypothetical protein ACREBB_02295 [Nitrosotalea sp.]
MILSSDNKLWIIIGIGLLPVGSLMLYEDMNATPLAHTWSFTTLFYVGITILTSSIVILAVTVVSALRSKKHHLSI